jgi:hypothetical protein
MDTSRQKKGRERQLLEAFFAISGIAGQIEEEREAPDFVVRVDDKQIGVELTEVFVPTSDNELPPKAKESRALKIMDDARLHYEARGGKPLHVAVGFSPYTDFNVLNRALTAKVVAEFLLAQDISEDRPQSWRPTLHGPLPREINFIHAFGVSNKAASHWYSPQAGWIVPLTEAILQACVETKSGKLSKYQSVAMECWLVLVVAGGAPSQGFDLRPQIDGTAIQSPFAQTYLLSLIDGTVQKLGISS